MKAWGLKKILAVVISIVLIGGFSVGSAVITSKEVVSNANVIENGLSAYELAVQYGYEGSVQEWLNSLNGKSAYEIAKENGYSGTEKEWLTTLEATAGKDGVGIKNIYDMVN